MSLVLHRLAQTGLVLTGFALFLAVIVSPGPGFLPAEVREMGWVLGYAGYCLALALVLGLERRRYGRCGRGLALWLVAVLTLAFAPLAAAYPLWSLILLAETAAMQALGWRALEALPAGDTAALAALWQGLLAGGIDGSARLGDLTAGQIRGFLDALAAGPAVGDAAQALPGVLVAAWLGFLAVFLAPAALLALERPPAKEESLHASTPTKG
ncbi:MAG: hypothetical protein RLO50_16560 [Azospirillaceae bacterium]